jgi:Glycosyl hydrolase family 79 C-terminal beta domain
MRIGHQRGRRLAQMASAIAVAALLASAVALALPDHDGITRATAGAGHGTQFASAQVAAPRRGSAPRPVRLPEAVLTIAPDASTVIVPSSYFGLSTEYWALPLFERNMPVFERVLSLLHVQGGGPLVLRIGGDSADHSFWTPKAKRMPGWAFALTPSFLARLRALVQRDRVRLIIDLNLVTDTPLTAATWAHAAETSLPRGSIVGFEVGNEPDLYERSYWLAALDRSPLRSAALPLELTPSTYVEDFAAYARVLGEGAPDIPLVGPAVAHPRISVRFISTLIEDERSELGEVTGHLYPYSACVKNPHASGYPTVAHLLSWTASGGLAKDVAGAVAAAHAAGLRFRLTEINSVTCGGKAGVSNTFATALWAPDALFTLMRAGVDGTNLHVRAYAINAPFSLTRRGLTPRPLLYGLILFTRMLGPQARLVRVHMTHPRLLNLSAWAVRVRGGILHVLVLDKSNRTVRVDLHLPATGPGTVQRLLAPSASSTAGETLDGQRLGPDGTWIGTRRTETITRGDHGYVLTVPQRSAALVAVRIGPAATAAPAATTAPARHAARGRTTARRRRATVPHRANRHGPSGTVAEQPGRRGGVRRD